MGSGGTATEGGIQMDGSAAGDTRGNVGKDSILTEDREWQVG